MTRDGRVKKGMVPGRGEVPKEPPCARNAQIKGMEQCTPEQCAAAVRVLHLAVSHLGGEPPDEVYTKDGYNIWLRAVIRSIADALGEPLKPQK